jgi:hypothetical protein
MLDSMMTSSRSNLDKLLENKDTPLETVLADSDVLTQCKWGNERLIK